MSPIDNTPMKYFASSEKDNRTRFANAVTSVAVLIVVAVVAGIFFLQVQQTASHLHTHPHAPPA